MEVTLDGEDIVDVNKRRRSLFRAGAHSHSPTTPSRFFQSQTGRALQIFVLGGPKNKNRSQKLCRISGQ